MIALSDADAALLARLLAGMQKPAGADIRTRERQRMAARMEKRIKRKLEERMRIKVTRATLVEDGRPVYSKALQLECDNSQLEDVRGTLKAELTREMTCNVTVDLQYKELEG